MSRISPSDTNLVPRREFIRDQHTPSSFSILALSGAALLRLYSFPQEFILALRKHLDKSHLILGHRELPQNNFYELSLEGKPWSNPKTTRTEKLLIEILEILFRNGHNFLSTVDYGREPDDRLIMAFSRPSQSPSHSPAGSLTTFQRMSNGSSTLAPHSVRVPFAISFISQNVLRVIAPPLHLTPAILQTVRGSWPRGVVSEKKVADNVYEFKLKGYRWFQEDTFATDSLRHILSLLSSLDGFGFTLLTSLSLNGRSRLKDLWVFTGLSHSVLPESQPSSPIGSLRPDLKAGFADRVREHRRSYTMPANSTNIPGHTRTATEGPVTVRPNNSSPPGPTSPKSGVVRKPAPRAQLPVSVAYSTGSNDSTHDAEVPPVQPAPAEEHRMELQSSVGSAVDMTGVGTQKYGRTGELDTSQRRRTPSVFYTASPGAVNSYFPSTPMHHAKEGSQPSGQPTGAQPPDRATVQVENPPASRTAAPMPQATPPRTSPHKNTPQSGTPTPPLLSPGAFRDSAFSSNTGRTTDIPITWTGRTKELGQTRNEPRNRDPKENVLPGGWVSTPAAEEQPRTPPDDYHDKPDGHDHMFGSPPRMMPKEQQVQVRSPELVHQQWLGKGSETAVVSEAPRTDVHKTRTADRLHSPGQAAPDPKKSTSPKVPAEGWVLVNVGQPSTPHNGDPPTASPSSNRKQPGPVTASSSPKPPMTRSPPSTGLRPTPTRSPASNSHLKSPSNPNPSSMSPAAKAIVIIDAMESKRKVTNEGSSSGLRRFFSLSRQESPSKSPDKGRKRTSSGGVSKVKSFEQEEAERKRSGVRERWRKRTPEATKSDRRMSVD
ncbi:hypothetical protein BC834DRAFT_965198 [Gloeopeniophorella convolvens]|nr:hypothetical protein BC834DRAFT_965198 [Gloeopeniophorella convolvens]